MRHRHLVRIFVGDLLVHLEQVCRIIFTDRVDAQPLDGVGEVQGTPPARFRRRRAARRRRPAWRCARRRRGGTRLPKLGVLALEVIVAFALGNLIGWALVALFVSAPTRARPLRRLSLISVNFGLVVAADGDAGRVNLREAGN